MVWKKKYNPATHDDAPTTEALRGKAAAYCSVAEHCRREVREKLFNWGATEDQVGEVLEYLEKESFLDETRYANAFANDRMRFQGWGRQKIRAGLQQKGIDGNTADAAIAQLDAEEYTRQLHSLAEKKMRDLRTDGNPDIRRQKLFRFLASRGFTYEEIAPLGERI